MVLNENSYMLEGSLLKSYRSDKLIYQTHSLEMGDNREYVSFKYNDNAQRFFCFDFSSNWVEGRISHDLKLF